MRALRRWTLPALLLAPLGALAIRGGAPARETDSSEVVALVDRGTAGMGIFGTRLEGVFCTGTLVSPTVVLTAAHCVRNPETGDARTDLPTQVSVFSGVGRANHLGPVQGQLKVSHALLHPDHERGVDLAVLSLQAASKLEPAVPTSRSTGAGAWVLSVGFGETRPEGKANTMGRKSQATRTLDLVDGGSLCSDRARTRTPSSAGDSGGPAFLQADAGRWLIGVLSGMNTVNVKGRAVEVDCWVELAPHLAWLRSAQAVLDGDGGVPEPSMVDTDGGPQR